MKCENCGDNDRERGAYCMECALALCHTSHDVLLAAISYAEARSIRERKPSNEAVREEIRGEIWFTKVLDRYVEEKVKKLVRNRE